MGLLCRTGFPAAGRKECDDWIAFLAFYIERSGEGLFLAAAISLRTVKPRCCSTEGK